MRRAVAGEFYATCHGNEDRALSDATHHWSAMIFPRTQSSAIAAVLTIAGAALFAADAQPQPVASAPQAAAQSSPQPAPAEGAGLQPLSNAPLPVSALPGGGNALLPDGVANWAVGQPPSDALAPSPGMPQTRVLPAHADNAAHLLPGNAAYSSNWLVDGVARVEAQEKRRRSADITRDGRRVDEVLYAQLSEQEKRELEADAISAGKNNAASNDPMVQYLQKWLASSSAAADAAIGIQSSDSGSAQAQPGAAGASPRAAAVDNAAVAAQLMQPTLEASGPSIVRLPPPPIQAEPPQATAPLAEGTRPMGGIPENTTLKIKPIDPKYDPSKPLVDDGKYFPQLRRF